MAQILCALADLAATGAKEIKLLRDGKSCAIVVVADRAGVRAFENLCPHARLPLNGAADRFFDAGHTVLVCVNHGAHFDPVTGLCLRGPCKGGRLRAFPATSDGESVLIA